MRQRVLILILIIVAFVWLFSVTYYLGRKPVQVGDKLPLTCPEINLVYTWVDGSDPAHIQSRNDRAGNNKWGSPGNNRFRDLGGLKYSLRSAEAYAPWVKRIYIVTSGQIPKFVNVDHPKIRLVFHSQIFEHQEDLPTFNSNAIEGNFYNLPDDAGPCFIYLNDDMFFANHVLPSDFYTEENGQILFTSSWTAPPSKDKLSNLWHRSVGYSNTILDGLWGAGRRNYASHGPYFFNLNVLRHMHNVIPGLFNTTSTHPFRHERDASVPFLYNQWTEHYFHSTIARSTINQYVKVDDDAKKTKKSFEKVYEKRPKTVCVNDALDSDNPNLLSIQYMTDFFEKLFPMPSEYEKEL